MASGFFRRAEMLAYTLQHMATNQRVRQYVIDERAIQLTDGSQWPPEFRCDCQLRRDRAGETNLMQVRVERLPGYVDRRADRSEFDAGTSQGRQRQAKVIS